MATTSTTTSSTSVEKMATSSTPTEPSLTSSIKTSAISATVQPVSTGFTMPFEAQITETKPETTPSTYLSTGITSEEPTTTETIAVGSTPADPSLTSSIDTVITSMAIQPTSTGFTMSFDPSTPPPSPSPSQQTTTDEPEITPSTSLSTCIPAEEATRRDKTNPTTSITSRSPQATTSDGPSRPPLIDSLMSRPKDWGFNVFLDELAAEITNEELKRLKHYVIGENGIGHGTLEKIETALEFFTILRRRNILTRDNIIMFQAMLWHLKRQDLHRKCVEYARNFGNAPYFYAPSPEPENGYRYVRFHVESNEMISFDRRSLEYIRTAVAELLLVPPEFVLVSGLEPSSSFIITFMIPEYYASLLIEMVVDYSTPQLLDVGIDKIYYDGKLYDLLGKGNKENIPGNYQGKLEDREELLERLQRSESSLDQREKEVIDLSRLLNKAERDLQKLREEKGEQKLVSVPTFQTKSAFTELDSCMKKTKELGHDTEDVKKFVEATTYFATLKIRDECRHDIQKLEKNIEELQLGLIRMKFGNLMVDKPQPELPWRILYRLLSGIFWLWCFVLGVIFF